ncbi:hypothetical protein [Sphingomonas oryzagri]
MKIPVPWNEQAVLVHHVAAASRRISGEGTLSQMIDRAAGIPFTERAQYTIFLPDRRVAPFDYGAEEFTGLITARSK